MEYNIVSTIVTVDYNTIPNMNRLNMTVALLSLSRLRKKYGGSIFAKEWRDVLCSQYTIFKYIDITDMG